MSRFAFDGAHHDRAGNRRNDVGWQAEARYLVLGGEHVATVDGPALRILSADEAPTGERLLLGELEGQTYGAVIVDRVPHDLGPTSLRTLGTLLSPGELSLAVHAVGIARWLAATPFCPKCGALTEIGASGHERNCPGCGTKQFPRTDPAVIMAVTHTGDDGVDRLLLARNAAWPEKRFSTLAGFVEPGESLEDTVRREVDEEVGVRIGEVEYLGSQPWPFPASIMLGFVAHATDPTIAVDHDEIAEARWFTRDELRDETASGDILLPPGGVSISSWLVEQWLGEPIQGAWF